MVKWLLSSNIHFLKTQSCQFFHKLKFYFGDPHFFATCKANADVSGVEEKVLFSDIQLLYFLQ